MRSVSPRRPKFRHRWSGICLARFKRLTGSVVGRTSALALGLVLGHASGAPAAITFVKNVATGGTATSSTATAVTVPPGGVAAGNTLIVTFAMDPATGTVSCGDARGNVYAKDVDAANGSAAAGVRTIVCSARVAIPLLEGDAVTVTHPAAAAKAISVNEFSGVGAFDRAASATGANATPSSAFTAQTSQADELVVGAIGVETDGSEAFTPDANHTALAGGTSGGAGAAAITIDAEFRLVAERGSYAAGGTLGASRLWSAAIATYRDLCGNGALDTGETCDKSAANSACCASTCTVTSAGAICRTSAGDCDVAETCTGASGACPVDGFQVAGTLCRAAADLCDAPEVCSGTNASCPADGLVAAGSVCRVATDLCDADETCTGASAACPADAVKAAGAVCRATDDTCDVVETCGGASAACPADASDPGCTGPPPGIAFVRNVGTAGNTTAGTATTITVPAGGVAVGNTLIVTFAMDPATGTVSCGDARGNVYAKDADVANGTGAAGVRTVVFSAPVTVSLVAGDTIVVAHPSVAAKAVSVNEFAGLGAFDRTAGASGANPAPSSGFTAATNQNDELVIGALGVEGPAADAFTAGAGYTALVPASSGSAGTPAAHVGVRAEFRVVAARGSYAAGGGIDPSRLWATAVATYRGRCGNGVVDGGEPCDKGVANGVCCSATCAFEDASTICRPGAGDCDVAETCSGASATCPADAFQPAATVCRAAADLCDAAETCSGTSAACPADALQPSGTVCRPATGACDAAETCSGASAACDADAVQPAGTVCRPPADACDLLEECTGASAACPPDLWSSGCTGPGPGIAFVKTVGTGGNASVSTTTAITVPAAGVAAGNALVVSFAMDPATGTVSCGDSRGNAYTRDADLANGSAAAGVRTVVCSARMTTALAAGDVVTVTHPAVAAKAISVNEFAGIALADRTASAAGTNGTPSSGFTTLTSQADELLFGAVGVETLGTEPFAPGPEWAALPPGASGATGSPAANVGTRPEFRIVAAAGSYAATGAIDPGRPWSAAIVAYRATCGNGVVDASEPCDRAAANSACCSPTCQLEVAATVCRAAVDLCDAAETCSGSGAACPADARRPAGSVCRAVSDVCDAAETCSGTSPACPADGLAPPGTVCRPASDRCDAAEVCTGASAACPADTLAPAGAVCRAQADACDLVESCSGGDAACPADVASPGCTGPGDGIAFVKRVGASGDVAPGTSLSVAVPAAGVAAGHTLIVTVAMDPALGTVSCGDSQGNVYAVDADVANGSGTAGVRTVVCSAAVATPLGVGDTVTVSLPTVAARGMSVDEFAGLAADALDRAALASGASTMPSSGFTAATHQPDELLLAAIGTEADATEPFVAGAGYTPLGSGSSGTAGLPDDHVTVLPAFRIVAAAGSFAAGATLQVARPWAAALVTYRAAPDPGGGATPTPSATPTLAPTATATPTPPAAATPSATPTATAGALVVDAFHCFSARTSKGTPKFAPRAGVHLVTDYDDVLVDVPAPLALCAPTDTDGGGIADPATHLERYKIKLRRTMPKHGRRVGVRLDDRLGTIFVDTVKPESLLVPTAMDLAVSPPPPDSEQHAVDHYACYTVKVARGTPFPKDRQITVEGTAFAPLPRRYLVKKPTRLCLPADADGEDRRHPDHLLCYRVKAARGRCAVGSPVNAGGGCTKEAICGGNDATSFCAEQGKLDPVAGVRAANRFGAEQIDVTRESEICLPALRTP